MIKMTIASLMMVAATSDFAEARYYQQHREGRGYVHSHYDRWRNPLASRYNSQPRRQYCSEISNASQFCP